MSDYTVQTVDLSTAHDPGVLVGGEDPPGRRVLIPEVPDTAYIRIGQDPEAGDPIPLLGGFQDCIEDGERVYIKNPAGKGTLRVVFTDDPDLDPGDIAPPSPTGFSPKRLGGELAAGTTFQADETRTADVAVTGADNMTLRGLITGIASLSEIGHLDAAILEDPGGIAVDEANDRAFTVRGDNGDLIEIDLTDPRSPVAAGSASPTTPTSAGHDVVFLPSLDKCVTLGHDGTEMYLVYWDVSTIGTPAFSSEAATGFAVRTEGHLAAHQGFEIVVAGTSDQLWTGDAANETALEDSIAQAVRGRPAVNENDDVIYFAGGGSADVLVGTIRSGGALFHSATKGTDAWVHGARFDPNLNVVIFGNDSSGSASPQLDAEITVWKVSPPLDPTLVGQVGDATGKQHVQAINTGDTLVYSRTDSGVQVYSYGTPEAPKKVGEFGPLDLNIGDADEDGIRYYAPADAILARSFRDFHVIANDVARGTVELIPLAPSGEPVANPREVIVPTDGVEFRRQIDLDGFGTVRVQMRSPVAGTIEYMDVYREAL